MDKKYQIFVSSTFEDLKNIRLRVLNTILIMRHFPSGMELFGASTLKQWDIIKNELDSSDYYILIMGQRYGSLNENGLSYTEMEFNYASKIGLPILAFIRNRDVPTRPSERDNELILQQKLETFYSKVLSTYHVEFWEQEDELLTKISISLNKSFINSPRSGWGKNVIITSYISDYTDIYLKNKLNEGLREVSVRNYKHELQILATFFTKIRLSDINHNDIMEYLEFRKKEYNIGKVSSLQTVRSVIRTFFEWLKDEGIITNNPVAKVQDYKSNTQRNTKNILSFEQITEIRLNYKDEREEAITELLLCTGCKLEEFLKIKLADFDRINRTIKLKKNNGDERLVPINDITFLALKKYILTRKDTSEYLIITERQPFRQLTASGVQFLIRSLAERCESIEKLSPKIFRDTFANNLLVNNCPLNIIQALLGHDRMSNTRDTIFNISNNNLENLRRYVI